MPESGRKRMMPRLQGKVAVITGGSSGLGLATAQRFVREGAFVYITGRRQNDLDMAAALIGDGVAPARGDVQDLSDLDRLYERIKQEKGKIDILVANAGFIDPQPLVDATEENFDKTFATNVRGLLFTVQKALPLLRDGGAIILISSIAAFKGIPRYTAYSATKGKRSFVCAHVDGGTQGPWHPCQRDQPRRDRHAHHRRAGANERRC
jgi:NAD(P)-dependent dehydrogenase (short-subunit alcohol dehydrogenase family)